MADLITLTIEDRSGERVPFAETIDQVFRHEADPGSFRVICTTKPAVEGPDVSRPAVGALGSLD